MKFRDFMNRIVMPVLMVANFAFFAFTGSILNLVVGIFMLAVLFFIW